MHQIVGDELMVIFGKDVTTITPPAPRAALVLQRVAKRNAAEQRPDGRGSASASSGEVHAGVGAASGHRKHGVVGDVVNLRATPGGRRS